MAPSIFSLFQHTKLIQQQGQLKHCTVCGYRTQKHRVIVLPQKFRDLPVLPSFSCPASKPFPWPTLSQSFDNLAIQRNIRRWQKEVKGHPISATQYLLDSRQPQQKG